MERLETLELEGEKTKVAQTQLHADKPARHAKKDIISPRERSGLFEKTLELMLNNPIAFAKKRGMFDGDPCKRMIRTEKGAWS